MYDVGLPNSKLSEYLKKLVFLQNTKNKLLY